jgi:hypothetical protein
LDLKEIQQALERLYYVALPPTEDNTMIMLHKLRNCTASEFDFDVANKTYIMRVEEYLYRNGPTDGIIFLDDLEGASLSYLLRASFSSIRKGLTFVQDGIPMNIKAVHILNTNPLASMIMALVKPLLRSDLLNKIHFHASNMVYEKFYEEHIPKSHLPKDYGGDLEPIEELHVKQRETFMEMRDYFLMEEQHMNYELDDLVDEYERIRKQKLDENESDDDSEVEYVSKF